MKKKCLILLCTQIYHIPLHAINLNWGKKTDTQQIVETIQAPKDSVINLKNLEGSFTVRPWDQEKISLEVKKKGTQEQIENTGISKKVEGKVVSISTHLKDGEHPAQIDYLVRVPETASINIVQHVGRVQLQGIENDIDISLENGSIDIKGSAMSVSAKTGNGSITVEQKKLPETSSIFLETHKGSVTLTLPSETRASLNATVQHGTIKSEHPVTFVNLTTKLSADHWERVKREISGVLGKFQDVKELEKLKDAAPITIEVTRGNIELKEQ